MMTTERITRDSCCCQQGPAELRSAWTGEGARPHTNLPDDRELHGERIRERRHAAKEKRPQKGNAGRGRPVATVAVGLEGSPALAGRLAAPPRAEYSAHA